MRRGFLPNRDDQLLAWSAAFSAAISAEPTAVGLSAGQAAAYAQAHAAFAAGMLACDPAARSKTSTAMKNTVREPLKQTARQLSSIVQGQAAVTDAQKITLGLTVRAGKRVIARPAGMPRIQVVSAFGTAVRIRLCDPASNGGLPVDVSAASVFSFVGAEPPGDLSEWTFDSNTGRTRLEIAFASNHPPGTRVWLTAFWFNGRKQSGPMCPPVGTNLPGGGVSMVA